MTQFLHQVIDILIYGSAFFLCAKTTKLLSIAAALSDDEALMGKMIVLQSLIENSKNY